MQLIISIVGLLAFGSYAAAYQNNQGVLYCNSGWSNIQTSCPNNKNLYCCLPQGKVDEALNIPRTECETPIGLEFTCGGSNSPAAGGGKCCP
ncbi:uncharacterized protein L3040_000999 [Drepanopeziza brunnea f. sp. 'multigermtubi']|uniref:uncharacterized protein n=1 Tax=Drepanopeziza brunnea f. sp. 'multigermtubi' TaxID=698441 RepID=UPI00238F5F78|nr:hypothetical protein L3040_000999 [Drepanopeziza brunnea f. sp. 'multigermtubi']